MFLNFFSLLQAKGSLNNLVQSLQVRPEPTRMCSTLAGSVTKEKRVLKLTPGANVIKLFFFVADNEAKYARAFVPGNYFPV
jgi:hypothetical protein